ncbi:glycosyltransferase family 2 protein [Solibacillus sp. CAU 1738]|uniref:glycosyltransferase n=1 Tax=Solibacillus sp. CAU 1738 TaxID=3140363 RepID=UPI0032619605
MLIIFYFAIKHYRRPQITHNLNNNYPEYKPTVTVLVPIYNEAIVINKTIEAILQSDYPITEILVIDDGSTDATTDIVQKNYGNNKLVKLISKKNSGKSNSLNIGIKNAIGEIIVTIDADTVFHRSTITHLVSHFSDPDVGAVSGNCKVGNIINQLTLWQHIEFVTSNNLEKRAFDVLQCITVVPGSNSAWRKRVVQNIGYYHYDILAEDAELTIRILNADYKVMYEDRAISYEESPETFKSFIKQRVRWSYGILQVAWKHRWNIAHSSNKTLKYFAIPSMLFSYLLFLTSPLIDVIFIASLIEGTKSIYLFALLFYVTDFLNSFVAFKLGKENMKPLLWIFIQRQVYRYLLAYVTWKAVLMALKGVHVGWNKLNRSGNNVHKI